MHGFNHTAAMRPRIPRQINLPGSSPPSRFFTHFNSPAIHRPQLPYLTQPRRKAQLQARWLTTDRKRWIVSEVGKGVKYTAIIWTFGVLAFTVAFGVQQELFERRYPSPAEWTWNTRRNYRSARNAEAHEDDADVVVDWARQGDTYRKLIKRLETEKIDGKGVVEQEKGGILVAGIGETGFDVTAKSGEWRRGYHDCLMGAAKAAEHLDGWVRDKVRNIAFPANVVPGSSNPQPRPLPPGAPPAPREEDCEPGFDPPEKYYMKVLTTAGFTPKQKIDAALAYASWLDYKGTPDTAREMYKWALDLCTTEQVFDGTGQLNPNIPVTSNLLSATTAMAVHQARNNKLSIALPLFLSILRARRSLSPPPASSAQTTKEPTRAISPLTKFLGILRTVFVPPAHSQATVTGTETLFRTPHSICEEAGLMAYVGEILYATAPGQAGKEDGLAWTREAVDVSEEILRRNLNDDGDASGKDAAGTDDKAIRSCRQCLGTGLENWRVMVAKLAVEEREKRKAKSSGGWLSFGGSGGDVAKKEEGMGRWESEGLLVVERATRVSGLLGKESGRVAGESGYLFA